MGSGMLSDHLKSFVNAIVKMVRDMRSFIEDINPNRFKAWKGCLHDYFPIIAAADEF
jgi:hypothetical protein